MSQEYGMDRVMEPRQVFPTTAWRLDNNREISSDEMRVAIKRVHIEGTSFRQICQESNDNDDAIRQKITDIVIRRGKLHNPVTDTGGLLYGIVEEIGKDYKSDKNLKVGDEVICNTSLASIPIYISKITTIDRAYNQVDAEGYAIIYNPIPIVRKTQGLPVDLLLYTLNESGTLYSVSKAAEVQKNFLVVGNNLMLNLLFGHTIRKAAGPDANIVNVIDKRTNTIIQSSKVDLLVKKTFNETHFVNILRPMEGIKSLKAEGYFDVTVNCADIPGAETLNILATREGGTVFFTNLINNYNIALYITETIARQLDIKCADGYLEKYDEFDLEIVTELAPYFEGATIEKRREKSDTYRPVMAPGGESLLVEDFISVSHAMALVMEEIMGVAKYDCNVLISGDTGVGKEKVANIIQKNSSRKMQPFVKINCASIPANLMESEFFGYEPGSFTGANTAGKKGYFEVADNGIVFLDEVGELPLEMQAKLLRVIQDGEFFRVGGTLPVKTNVRIISATNRDLEEFIENKTFRRDLYYRLNVFPVKVPSLNERREDIPPLVEHFVQKYGKKFGMTRGIDENAVEYLAHREWKGNIRELENVVQRLLINAKGENIAIIDVMRELHGQIFDKPLVDLPEQVGGEIERGLELEAMVHDFEKQIIRQACDKYGSTRKVAAAIGISQTQLVRKKKKYGIQ
jgi:TyrR family helix-turn-helix protein